MSENNNLIEENKSEENNVDNWCAVVQCKEKTDFSKHEKIFAFAVIAFSFFFVHLALWNASGFFTTALYIVIITSSIVFLRKSGCIIQGVNKALAVVLYLFSFVFSVTANPLIKFLDIVFLLVAGAYFVYNVSQSSTKIGRYLPFELVKTVVEAPFMSFTKGCEAVNHSVRKTKFGPTIKLIIIGLVIAIPLTLIVGNLLMSADSGVEKILGDFANAVLSQNIWSLIVEFAISIPVGCWLFGLFFSNIHKKKECEIDDESCEKILSNQRRLNNVIVYSAVTPVCILYVIFFISQATYFLSAFAGKLPADFSYAEYARRGFFELFAIEMINVFVICFISIFSEKSGEKKPVMLKIYTVIISLFTLVIIATAISKMIMYISTYGLTQLRVYTTWFMVLTALVFVMVIIKQFKFNMRFSTASSVIFTVMFAVLCFSRPDALIAKYNMETHYETYGYEISEMDLREMCAMSDDAVSVILDSKYSQTIRNAFGETEPEFRKQIEHSVEKNIYVKTNISALLILDRI